jgi:hypothetical protein
MSIPSPLTGGPSTITITCPLNQPSKPLPTTGLRVNGTADTTESGAKIQCKLVHTNGMTYSTAMIAYVTPWTLVFSDTLPVTDTNKYAGLTAYLYDSKGSELNKNGPNQIKIAASGTENCPAPC